MARWTCPRCDRQFGRARQAHVCVPGGTVDASFAGRPDGQRRACEAILAQLRALGPVHVDAVQVGVFLKRQRTIAELRPMARALSVNIVLRRLVTHPRIVRTIGMPGGRTVHIVRVTGPDQVDDELGGWLAEAYHAAGS